MSRMIGTIREIFIEGGVAKAQVNVDGNHSTVALTLMLDARVGDKVVISSGIAHMRSTSVTAKEV